jgi:starvation-inducible DNA-binding protein
MAAAKPKSRNPAGQAPAPGAFAGEASSGKTSRGKPSRSMASPGKSGLQGDAMLETPTDLSSDAVQAVSEAINGLVADAFSLYLKTKNFHWHVSGPHFRDYHLMLDEHAEQIFASTDPLAERVRKIGGKTLRGISHIERLRRIQDNEADFVSAADMLRELLADNKAMATAMRQAHEVCDEHDDVATASLLEELIDQTERRTWFLFEASRSADDTGH